MITEDYVSFETARLLKEKGFKIWCYKCYGTAVYHKGVPISFDEECELRDEGLEDEIEYVEGGMLYDYGCNNHDKDAKVWAAPTLWVAMKWLREMYKIDVSVYPYEKYALNNYQFDVYKYNLVLLKDHGYITYEDAVEAAIRYCLENLV